MIDLKKAHAHCHHNRGEIEKSEICGCFYCKQIFDAIEVDEYVDQGTSALCPRCHIDSVIADASKIKIDEEFLNAMHKEWFQREFSEEELDMLFEDR